MTCSKSLPPAHLRAHGAGVLLCSPVRVPGGCAVSRLHRLKPITNRARLPHGHGSSCGDGFNPDANSSSQRGVSPASLPLTHQHLAMGFNILDRDADGLISRLEAHKLVAYYLALQNHKPAVSAGRPLTWDQHLLASLASAGKLSGGNPAVTWEALECFVAAKMSGGLQKTPPRCSDLVWASLGMGAAMGALGLLAASAQALPFVGALHHAGLPLLLGSFGTFAILLFGRPDAEAVRLWPLLAGQLGATAIAVGVVQAWGASLMSRAAAMAATVAYMMWTDCIHPPGGALVLMAMDSKAIQSINCLYLIYPSLALCLAVLLPISAATNWLRRNHQFDWPGSSNRAASLHQKRSQWAQEQQMRAAVRELETLERGGSSSGSLPPLHRQIVMQLAAVLGSIARLWHALAWQLQLRLHQQQQPVKQLQQATRAKKHKRLPGQQRRHFVTDVYDSSLDGGSGSSFGSWNCTMDDGVNSVDAAQQGTAAAAESLGSAVRPRLMREAERQLEDQEHRQALWGGAEPGLGKYEEKLQQLQQQRLGSQDDGQQQEEGKQQAALDGQLDAMPLFSPGSSGSSRVSVLRAREGQRPAWMYRWMEGSSRPMADDNIAPDEPRQ